MGIVQWCTWPVWGIPGHATSDYFLLCSTFWSWYLIHIAWKSPQNAMRLYRSCYLRLNHVNNHRKAVFDNHIWHNIRIRWHTSNRGFTSGCPQFASVQPEKKENTNTLLDCVYLNPLSDVRNSGRSIKSVVDGRVPQKHTHTLEHNRK